MLADEETHQLYHRTGGVPLAIVWSVAQMAFGNGVESVLIKLEQPANDIAKFCFEAAVEKVKETSAEVFTVGYGNICH